ncbi:MAG: molybdopterin-guanine dinucleotide biosynthesis protein B [Methylophilaceae bacterium]|nr:molybdopterin-guanine dinucleotide biosynthesis protein B [Methylophilaceae bacterium]MBL6726596.1 molybdopterin-guanine dinucleotide biosynthesis protein B [Methylophilaceae bacterium]MBL6729214.1 molybdopterin-guanine dinucleotide biosynthesis protein B [Methylophilaceae bacterium]MBL6791025.1 molybdopterin-guanine dinucleotide biosynthesis protein B [Methylophilaceae bacterium]
MTKIPLILTIVASNSGAGKTTFIEKIIPGLIRRGLKISSVKHAHHDFDIDHEGKDSYRLRKAGSYQTLVMNTRRSALLTEFESEPVTFEAAIKQMDQNVDLILIEGLKSLNFPKIEVYRSSVSKVRLAEIDSSIIAIVSNESFSCNKPVFDINDTDAVEQFIFNLIKQ